MAEQQQPQYYPLYGEGAEKPLDLKYYFFLFKKNFYVILTFFIIVVTLASIYTAKMPEEYQAAAQILIEKPQVSTEEPTAAPDTAAGESEDYYNTQIEIMRSDAVLRQVIQELKLVSHYGVESEQKAILELQKKSTIQRVGSSRIFNIQIKSDDPQLSASIANAIARAYIRRNFENMLYYSKEIVTWLPQNDPSTNKISIEDPFGSLKQISREELVETLPGIQTDPTLRGLKEKKSYQEAELESLLKRYREKHPVIVKARASLKFLDESIDAEKKRIIDNLKSQAEGKHRVANARIIEEAKPPQEAVPVNRLRIILIVALAELLLSFMVIILLDRFDDTLRSAEDFERKGVNLPFLGHVPLVKKKLGNMDSKGLLEFYSKNTDIAEAFRYLRVAINFSASPESLKCIAFASCLPHEGKSFVSHNIAISLAMDGNKTLLIDADLRRPVVHRTFNADNASGLSNFLTSNLEFDTIVKSSPFENLSLVLSGPVSPNPGEILGSERMKQFLEEAKKRYDRVIIDCPPLTGLGDTYVIGSQMGQLIMVIGAGKTPVDLIKHTQKQLEKANVKIIGAILNSVDIEKERFGGYSKHYYHTYTRYYHKQ